jgi:iron(III) transport system ATP-binding protein
MGEAIWVLENVELDSGGERRLSDVALRIERGVTAVVGPSGAGKTSLLNLLVGFEAPSRGRIHFEPPTPQDGPPIFWAPQDGGLWLHLTVREHLEAVCPAARADAVATADSLLDGFDLADRARARPEELSMGQRARLAVARALASRARVLVLDEPLAHVDGSRLGAYWSCLRDHTADRGTSVVFASHAPEVVIAEAERAICLQRGRVLYDGDVESLYRRPTSDELAAFLGPANWLSDTDRKTWFTNGQAAQAQVQVQGHCCRPHQLEVAACPDGPIVVRTTRFGGEVCDSVLEHRELGLTRRFWHRPAAQSLRAGMSVVLRLGAAALLAVGAACGGPAEPALAIRQVRSWALPPDGHRSAAPRSIDVCSDGRVVVLDSAGRVLIYDDQGALQRTWRMPESDVGKPEGVRLLRDGRLAVADTHYSRVVFFDDLGNVVSMLGANGEEPGNFLYPVKVAEDDTGNIYVAEYGGNDRIQKFSPQGKLIGSFGGFSAEAGSFQRPSGLIWSKGHLYVADAINNRIQVFTDEGGYLRSMPDSTDTWTLKFPYDVAMGPDGFLYVVEYGAGRVTVITTDGRLVGRFGSAGRGHDQLATPWGLDVDHRGHILVADTGNRRILELTQ